MWDFDSRDEDVTCRDKTRHRGVARIWEAGGGCKKYFFIFAKLHVAKRLVAHGKAIRFARGVRGHAPLRISVQFVEI